MASTEAAPPAHGDRSTVALAVTLAALVIVLTLRFTLNPVADALLVQAASATVLLLVPLLAMKVGMQPIPSRPDRGLTIAAFVAGILASIAGAWLLAVADGLLTLWVGPLDSGGATAGSDLTILLVQGLLLPVGQSVLFWLYLLPRLSAVARRSAPWLGGWLFAGAAILTSNMGVSAGVAALPLGLAAALLVELGGTAWLGLLTTVVHALAGLLLPPYLLALLGLNALSLNWAGAALLSLFGLFLVLQVVRAVSPPRTAAGKPRRPRRQRPLLWGYSALVMAVTALELFLRSRS